MIPMVRVTEMDKTKLHSLHLFLLCISSLIAFVPPGQAQQAPVFEIIPVHSSIKFHVKSSTTIVGKFDKWDATLKFVSPEETTGSLELKIEASSVNTGSGGKLKSKDFFDVEQNPYITFQSTKFVPTSPHTYEVDGDFTIRGVSNPEKLILTVSGKGNGSGEIHGAMVFNRKKYGMDKGIPFIQDLSPSPVESLFPSSTILHPRILRLSTTS